MKMKKLLSLSLAAFGAIVLSGCSLFTNDEYALSSFDTSYDQETGNTYITFYFTDEEQDPFVVTIPQKVGEDGVDITAVTPENDPDNRRVRLTITYSDNRTPTVLYVPYGQDGEDGKSVSGLDVGSDSNGNITIAFVYSDGSHSDPVTIPSGNGIASITTETNLGVTTITISFTDPNMPAKTFQVSNGIGIDSIFYNDALSNETQYVLTIVYSDGYSEEITLARPQATHWYYGNGAPNVYNVPASNPGDYYIDIATGNVYGNNNGTWSYLFCMKAEADTGSETYYWVNFNPNGGYFDGDSALTGVRSVHVQEGKTLSLANIPTPERDGYSFAGWFTDPENINAGQFTDLTIVTKTTTLYARWSA